jgi:hypothetical protein
MRSFGKSRHRRNFRNPRRAGDHVDTDVGSAGHVSTADAGLMQRRLMQLYTAGQRSQARIPIELGPDDIRILASEIGRFQSIT